METPIIKPSQIFHYDHGPGRRWGVLFRWGSCWIGAHWSPSNRRLCVNLIPFVTIWVIARDGVAPQ